MTETGPQLISAEPTIMQAARTEKRAPNVACALNGGVFPGEDPQQTWLAKFR
jgi:hypothetical protein